ncbi:MAG TPA: hypothetical protein VMF32_24305 [Xanthobacteraceae bacterium]|nr:hypothetical protein [Xanthobacteraceae bacterium]
MITWQRALRLVFGAPDVIEPTGGSGSQFLVVSFAWLLPCMLYWLLMSGGPPFDLLFPVGDGMVFNNMLAHLLHGSFEVNPNVLGGEAFVRNGRTYTYFGVFCALLRLPLIPFGKLETTDITAASIVAAASVSWLFRLLALRTVLTRGGQSAPSGGLVALLVLAFGCGGEGVQFMRASIYQEVMSWADAFASLFVFLVIFYLIDSTPRRFVVLPYMGLAAGLALLTRVSTGLGLYVATTLILLIESFRVMVARHRDDRPLETANPRGHRHGLGPWFLSRLVGCLAVLGLFALLAGAVNYERWGNPLTFADFRYYRLWAGVSMLKKLGEFNIVRLPLGLQYYFFPLWIVQAHDGTLLFEGYFRRMVESAELPPGSFFLSDPLVVVLSVLFAWQLRKARRLAVLDTTLACAALAGLAVPACLMLVAMVMAFRYRMEFYPFFDTASLLGLFCALRFNMLSRGRRLARVSSVVAVMAIPAAFFSLLLYKLSPFGWGWGLDLAHGWAGYYSRRFVGQYPYVTVWLSRHL